MALSFTRIYNFDCHDVFCTKLFVGIAFDAGGVATGPMTATFILAYIQGVADAIEWASVMRGWLRNDFNGGFVPHYHSSNIGAAI